MERSEKTSSSPGEARFLRFMIAMILLVTVTQVLLRFEGPRRFLNRSIRLEGESLSRVVQGLEQQVYPWLEWPPADTTSESSTWATVYLRFMGSPPKEAWVLLNGRVAKQLGPEGGTVTVRDGDAVELYSAGEISVVISAATDNLVSPRLGEWVIGSGTVRLGVVRLR